MSKYGLQDKDVIIVESIHYSDWVFEFDSKHPNPRVIESYERPKYSQYWEANNRRSYFTENEAAFPIREYYKILQLIGDKK